MPLSAEDCRGMPCAWCGKPSTHLCTGCDKCICFSPACIAKSAAVAAKKVIYGLDFATSKYISSRQPHQCEPVKRDEFAVHRARVEADNLGGCIPRGRGRPVRSHLVARG